MALLKTKFLQPVTSSKTIPRSRLFTTLTPRAGKRATFIIAPAGFGKTTLLAHWAREPGQPVCWLSLDATDDTTHNFWRYFIGALQQQWPDVGVDALYTLSTLAPSDFAPLLTSLLNDVAAQHEAAQHASESPVVSLVLDDYHLIEEPAIQRGVAYLIDYLPPNLHLIIASRIEPDLPLPRWRVKNYIDELYTADLAFSAEETQAFFTNYAGLELQEEDLAAVQQATNGWIAAIQLITLSQRKPEAAATQGIQNLLATGKRLIDDYVLTEILDRQPLPVRDFLLESACLLRMNPELCDRVREASDSRDMLSSLEKSNLFIVPLDNRHYWYRYHDLFREALVNRVQIERPDSAIAIQRKAVSWYLEQAHYHEALSQLIVLQDWNWLVQVLESQGNALIREGYHLHLIEWLNRVPSTRLDTSPRLLMLRIWCLFYDNKLKNLRPLIQQLEQLLATQEETSSLDAREQSRLRSEIALIRSYLARAIQQPEDANQLTRQVLERIQETDIPLKSVSYYGVALDYFDAGKLDMAIEALEAAIHHGKLEQRYSTVLSSLGLLMWVLFRRGNLVQALDLNQSTQIWVENFHKDQPQPDLVSCWRNTALCEIYREQNDLAAAQAYLNPLLRYFDTTEPPQRVMIHYSQAGLAFSKGRFNEALEQLDIALTLLEQNAEQIMFEPPSLRAMKLRCYLALGKLDQAEVQAQRIRRQNARNPLNRQRENLCLARLEIARGQFKQAEAMLAAELEQARDQGFLKHELQAAILLALVHQGTGRLGPARQLLAHALEQAERQRAIRLFSDEDIKLRGLVAGSDEAGISSQFRAAVLAGFAHPIRDQTTTLRRRGAEPLAEPLSKRELEVLELIYEGLPNKEIATRLSLAPATVKAHIRNLYGKIGASSRTEALARARKFGLIDGED